MIKESMSSHQGGRVCLTRVVSRASLHPAPTYALTQCVGYSPTMGPPVAVVQPSGEGKFAFVEFRDETMAVTAMQLDKVGVAPRDGA